MVRSFSTQYQDALGAEEQRPFHLLEMTIGSATYRYTDCDVPITYSSNVYSQRGFDFQSIDYSMGNIVDKATVVIDSLDYLLNALFVGGTPQGSATVLRKVLLDSDYAIIGTPATLFEGEIDSWDFTERVLRFTVTSPWHQWNQQTLSKHSPSCRWKQFGTTAYDECNYTGGESWCDRTYARCEVLGNTTNFGGFRYLPSIIDRDIWWGKIPKND
jgi:hypothetical protein